MGYFSDSEEDNTTNGSSYEKQDARLSASQSVFVKIDVPTDNCSDEPVENGLYRNQMEWLRRNDLEELNSFQLALLESIRNVSADFTIIKSESLIILSIATISEYLNTFFDNKKLIVKLMATQVVFLYNNCI
uniref:NR LBD domain-containing protein n=1 Tax=Strongyloides stercoralis TaxID=6248 RepID=A0AAF5D6K0_STRER